RVPRVPRVPECLDYLRVGDAGSRLRISLAFATYARHHPALRIAPVYPSRRFISLIGFCVVACDEPAQTGGDGSLPTTSTDSSTSDTEVPGVDATELGPVQLVVFDALVAEVAGPL